MKEGSRFVCSFGCGKSYSAKCNLSNHEIKVHNRPKLKNRKSQKPTASPKKQEEEEKVAQAAVETNDELTAGGNLGNSETGDVIDAEEATIGGAEELEESNASLLNDSSLGDYDFEEKEPEVGGNSAEEEAAVDGPALSEAAEVEEDVEANDVDEETRPKDEEVEATASEGGAANVLADSPTPKDDHEREAEEETLEDGKPTERTAGILDLKASEYFTKYPKAIANPQVSDLFNHVLLQGLLVNPFLQERSLKLFNEDAEGLPEGWKVPS